MDFRYGTAFAVPPPEAYERLLLDVMLGDPTLFTRTDEVESAWRFITSILDAWQQPDAPPPGHLRRRELGARRGRRAAEGRRGEVAMAGGCEAGSMRTGIPSVMRRCSRRRQIARCPTQRPTRSSQGQGIPVDLREIETELIQQLWGPAAEQVGGPEPEQPARHADRAGEPGRRAPRRRTPSRCARCVETVITRYPVPGDRGARVGRRRAADHAPRSRRSATCPPRACRRSAPSGSCSAPGPMPST